MGSKQPVSIVYDDNEALETALWWFRQDGFPVQRVSVIAQDFDGEKKITGNINSSSAVASTGLGTVGIVGFPGKAASLWMAVSMRLVVAGPPTTALLDGMENAGGAESGLLGWLAPLDLPEDVRRKYEECVKARKYLVILQGAVNRVKKTWQILKTTSPSVLDVNFEG
jgi:hypothetical protein